ncbi:MAG TPA: GDP-fucose synthetase [Candidatus Omnitrophica bacterium]|nr:MAG: GDP-fucose synthetase [Omnitrophica WOR_2 bacterium GWA2_45_18]HBR14471.1 GDP-fucose synthetase [Candidatus Omnitrophota bacterium]
MRRHSKILIVGHDDIVENALVEHFQSKGFSRVFSSSAMAMDTTIQTSVYDFFSQHRPEYVFLGSTRSGGIEANRTRGAEFIYHNLESQNNILYAAHKFGVEKLLFLASSCVYPKDCPQPIREESLLTGELEKTSEPYAVAKIAGIKLCQAFRRQYGLKTVVMIPATIYGPGSDMDIQTAHVIGALIGKFESAVSHHEKQVTVWGTGTPRREFIYVEDFVQACLFLMEHYDQEEIVNAGCGYDVTIKELSEMVAEAVGYKGDIIFDSSKPDGTAKKLLHNSRITKLGWRPRVSLKEGVEKTVAWFKEEVKHQKREFL